MTQNGNDPAGHETSSGAEGEAPVAGHSESQGTPSGDVQEALDIARALIKGGVAVFAAPPCPAGCGTKGHGGGGEGKYHLPMNWQGTVPSEVNLNRWQPGWALAAVGGRAADFLDVDPRSGGDASLAELEQAGQMPTTFGRQKTPSGGDHYVIAPTGERECNGFMPGLDLQSGQPAVTHKGDEDLGRAFVYIAPTVRRSKVTGELEAYRWEVAPDLELLAEVLDDARESNAGLIERVRNRPAKTGTTANDRTAQASDPNDPFLSPSQVGSYGQEGRRWTAAGAWEWLRELREACENAQKGYIEHHANNYAIMLSRFVPEFMTVDRAKELLHEALLKTIYDPNHPASTWDRSKWDGYFEGWKKPRDPWKAIKVPDEDPKGGAAMGEAAPGAKTQTRAEKLAAMRAKLLSRDAVMELPPIEPLVEGLLDLDSESWLISEAGGFKSFIALDIAAHVGAGEKWRGAFVTQGPVLYIVAEGKKGINQRVKAWEKTYDRKMENVMFYPEPVFVKPGPRDVAMSEDWSLLVELAGEIKPVLVVIDTQARTTVGLDENDNSQMGVYVAAVSALKQATGACVLTIHHVGRNGGDARGASAIDGAQDTELRVSRPSGKKRNDLTCTLGQDKQKDSDESVKWELQMVVQEVGTHPRTGKPITSLAVGQWDPFVVPVAAEPSWKRELEGAAREVMEVMEAHSGAAGATFPEIDAWINESRKERDKEAPRITKQTRSTAIKLLCGEGKSQEVLLVRDGKSRVVLPEFVESSEAVL